MHRVHVEVIRSPKRRKTVQARVVEGVLRVAIPASMSAEEEAHWVDEMRRRIERRALSTQVDLPRRAAGLAARYDLPEPTSIRWSNRQNSRWGSATAETGAIRISSRLSGFPTWVLDYVIVHELAHLVEANHSRAFWRLVEQYPLTERARGYLIARSEDGSRPAR